MHLHLIHFETFQKHFRNVTKAVRFLRYLQRILTRLIHDSVV